MHQLKAGAHIFQSDEAPKIYSALKHKQLQNYIFKIYRFSLFDSTVHQVVLHFPFDVARECLSFGLFLLYSHPMHATLTLE
jgi:hypothetical protein